MKPDFILMLTREDRTIPDAREVYAEVGATALSHVGCKDVGAPLKTIEGLFADAHAKDATTYLEVVSETTDDMIRSTRTALELRPDRLIGGNAVKAMLEILDGSGIELYPWVGQVIDHPSLLRGSIDEIVEDAQRVQALGASGINLLAYRYNGDVTALIRAVRDVVHLPLICAGSIATLEQIRWLTRAGVDGFTIGTAVLDRRLVDGAPLPTQVEAALEAANDS